MDDAEMRAYLSELPTPEFPDPAWVSPPTLSESTVAIVTTAAVHQMGDAGFEPGDATFRVFAAEARDLALGHRSPSFDRIGFAVDVNVVVPVDRLTELAADGVIGAVAPRHVSFLGSQPDDVATVRYETGPRAAAMLRDDGVHVAVLTPMGPMCTRTIGVLAHVLEGHGIATVAAVPLGRLAERMGLPRALVCEFPLGRPLGRPDDPAYQHRVLARAMSTLDAATGPVIQRWPDEITLAREPMVCAIPGTEDAGGARDAADEVRALVDAHDAYVRDRGRTSVGIAVTRDRLGEVARAFAAIAAGTPWRDAGVPGHPVACALDLRTYFEEAALMLVDAVPGAGAAERWFYERTIAGRTLQAARLAMHDADAPFSIWYYLTTGDSADSLGQVGR